MMPDAMMNMGESQPLESVLQARTRACVPRPVSHALPCSIKKREKSGWGRRGSEREREGGGGERGEGDVCVCMREGEREGEIGRDG
jgi:hypothetical protein